MRVSQSWLKQLVTFTDSLDQIAESLSMAGFEVESIQRLSEQAKGVKVGFIQNVTSHPDADKLSVCSVDIGLDECLQIVCGASNVRPNTHVAVAPQGVYLPAADLKIKPCKLRGVSSTGMICSLQELGLSKDSDGILILDELGTDLPPIGTSVTQLLGLDDNIIELAITANRPDGLSMVGIAREISALTGSVLTLPKLEEHQFSHFKSDPLGNVIDKCNGIYGITLIEELSNNLETPNWIKNRLERAGLNHINTIVDITNLIMLEQGQPLHAFDADLLEQITGKDVTKHSFGIRNSYKGENFVGLDGKKYMLTSEIQLITCHDIPVALAGVIGGLDAAVNKKTQRIWLESAVFSSASVRSTSRAAGIRTESSTRFEKGIPVEMTLLIAERAKSLLQKYNGGKIVESWFVGATNHSQIVITLRREKIHSLLGPCRTDSINNPQLEESKLNPENIDKASDMIVFLPDSIIENSLKALGCRLESSEDGWTVIVPNFRRKDLLREIDLIEEIARLVGYDNFEANLPDPIRPGQLTNNQKVERDISYKLASIGFQEVTTFSLVGSENSDPDRIPIKNPLLMETSHLRTGLSEEHINICSRNLNIGKNSCWIYEIGKKYYKGENGKIIEKLSLSGLISGKPGIEKWVSGGKRESISYYEARGLLERLFRALKLNVSETRLQNQSLYHPGRSSLISLDGREIGKFGQLNTPKARDLDINDDTFLFDIDLEKLIESACRKSRYNPTFKQYPTVPSLERDITIIVSKSIASYEITKLIHKQSKSIIESVQLVGKYEASSLGDNNISLTYRLIYRGKNKTLTDEEIRPVHENILTSLTNHLGAKFRS